MFCRNCGKDLPPEAGVCTQCGVPVGVGNHYCPHCGSQTDEQAVVCVRCGINLRPMGPQPQQPCYGPDGRPYTPKSKLAAGLLGILLGSLGIHNFYLGFTNRGIAQILLTTVGWIICGLGPAVAAIWGLVEGIQIFTGTIHQDSNGNELGE